MSCGTWDPRSFASGAHLQYNRCLLGMAEDGQSSRAGARRCAGTPRSSILAPLGPIVATQPEVGASWPAPGCEVAWDLLAGRKKTLTLALVLPQGCSTGNPTTRVWVVLVAAVRAQQGPRRAGRGQPLLGGEQSNRAGQKANKCPINSASSTEPRPAARLCLGGCCCGEGLRAPGTGLGPLAPGPHRPSPLLWEQGSGQAGSTRLRGCPAWAAEADLRPASSAVPLLVWI